MRQVAGPKIVSRCAAGGGPGRERVDLGALVADREMQMRKLGAAGLADLAQGGADGDRLA